MKPIKWLINLLIGVVLGIVLTIGGAALAGYIVITKPGMVGVIDDKMINGVDLPEDIRAMSLLDISTGLFSKLQNIQTATIGEIEDSIGTDSLSQKIASSFDIPQDDVRASTFADLPNCIMDSLKVRTLNEKFSVEFPDFPLFQNDEFLDKQFMEAFAGLDDETLDMFIDVVYEGDPDPEKTPSSKFLQKIGVLKMSEISSDMDAILADSTIEELITVDDDSEPIIKALRDVKLNSTDLNNAIADLTVADVFKDYDTGVLSLVLSDTKLDILPVILSGTITDTNLYQLVQLDVYSVNLTASTPEVKANLYNKNPNDIIAQYALIVADPTDAQALVASRTFNVSGVITQATIDSLPGFRNGDTLILMGDSEIPADTLFTSVFNIEADGYNLIINTGVAIDNSGGYMYIRDYTGSPVTITSVQSIRKSTDITVDAVFIDFI